MTTVTLTRPIQAHGSERKQIELREPNGVDIQECGGDPRAGGADKNGNVVIVNPHVVANYISRLGEVPPSSVGQLCAIDWTRCQNAIIGFFREPESDETPISSTDISTSPGSGNGVRERRSTSLSAN